MLVLPRVETHGFLVSHALRTKLTEVINKKTTGEFILRWTFCMINLLIEDH